MSSGIPPPHVTDDDVFLSWPADVQALIHEVRTIEALDVLCCAASNPSRSWDFDTLVATLGHERLRVTEAVAHLVGKGFLEACGVGDVRYTLSSPRLAPAVSELVRLSDEDRANLLGAIAHFSIWRIRSTAVDAFVHRRPRPPSDH
jgi:hypothetical protein